MAKIDKVKETIGYLKVVFGIFVAVDISMVGWLFRVQQNLAATQIVLVVCGIVIATTAIIFINHKILKKIDELEEL